MENMDFEEKGICMGSQVGFLDLNPDLLESLVCTDPITDHFDVEMTAFARGKFAVVRRARCLRSGAWFAAKVVRRRRRARDARHETVHEAAVLSLAREHPRIIRLHKVFEGPSDFTFILELASGGELQRVIDEEERIEERVVRTYLRHVLVALRFLHANNIAHLDLKPQNILLCGPHPTAEVKLCDFGISRLILGDIEVREILGTPDYVAPEILKYEPISLATDMWSVGVLAYVLLTGHSPFGGDTKQETFLNISKCRYDFPQELFYDVSAQAQDFISKLLVVETIDRLTVQEALSDPWLATSTSSTPCTSLVIPIPRDETETTIVGPLKRASSPGKGVATDKENDRNAMNNSLSPTSSTASPPSKRECRDALSDGEEEAEVSASTSPAETPTRPRTPQSPRPPRPLGSPKVTPPSRGRVSRQIKSIESRMRRTPSAENVDDPSCLSVPTEVRRGGSARSFGAGDRRPEIRTNGGSESAAINALGIPTTESAKCGARTDFQDIVIRNDFIY